MKQPQSQSEQQRRQGRFRLQRQSQLRATTCVRAHLRLGSASTVCVGSQGGTTTATRQTVATITQHAVMSTVAASARDARHCDSDSDSANCIAVTTYADIFHCYRSSLAAAETASVKHLTISAASLVADASRTHIFYDKLELKMCQN